MTTTTTSTASPPLVGAGGVRGLDTRQVLAGMVATRRAADRAEADLLRLVVHYVDLHPATDHRGAAAWGTQSRFEVDGDQAACSLAGDGAPQVAEYAIAELGAALDLSFQATLGLVADSLELCFRLPRLWDLVQTGRLQAWKARKVATRTPDLSGEAVAFVDRHAAVPGAHNQLPDHLVGLVHEALLQCDPDAAAGIEEAALVQRDVVFDYQHGDSTATTHIFATVDTLDAIDLDHTVTSLATTMGRLGDNSPLGVRRAHALGSLAHPQRTLDLYGNPRPSRLTPPDATPGAASGPGSNTLSTGGAGDGWNAATGTVYLHIDADDLDPTTGPGGGGVVEKLGTATLDLLRDWLLRLDRVTVRPVLNPTRPDSVDRHDPPGWMREAVILRDGHCVFPGCRIDARGCDLDHIAPYLPPDDGGPPGQTSTAALACLCRRHHRVKTFTAWTYHRTGTGDYQWTSPHHRTYTTHPTPRAARRHP